MFYTVWYGRKTLCLVAEQRGWTLAWSRLKHFKLLILGWKLLNLPFQIKSSNPLKTIWQSSEQPTTRNWNYIPKNGKEFVSTSNALRVSLNRFLIKARKALSTGRVARNGSDCKTKAFIWKFRYTNGIFSLSLSACASFLRWKLLLLGAGIGGFANSIYERFPRLHGISRNDSECIQIIDRYKHFLLAVFANCACTEHIRAREQAEMTLVGK